MNDKAFTIIYCVGDDFLRNEYYDINNKSARYFNSLQEKRYQNYQAFKKTYNYIEDYMGIELTRKEFKEVMDRIKKKIAINKKVLLEIVPEVFI